MPWFELICSVGAALCVPAFVVWNILHPKAKKIRRLEAIVDEAHHDVHELRSVAAESAAWEGRQYEGWMRVHQAATKALKEYGPEGAYRGQAAPGREGLVEIQLIAAGALSTRQPASAWEVEELIEEFIQAEHE